MLTRGISTRSLFPPLSVHPSAPHCPNHPEAEGQGAWMVQSTEDSLPGHRAKQRRVEVDMGAVETNQNNRDFNFSFQKWNLYYSSLSNTVLKADVCNAVPKMRSRLDFAPLPTLISGHVKSAISTNFNHVSSLYPFSNIKFPAKS